MKTMLTLILFLASLGQAQVYGPRILPPSVSPDCVLGFDFKFENDQNNDIISAFHKDGLFKLMSQSLSADKKYYLAILDADQQRQKMTVRISVSKDADNKITCNVNKTMPSGLSISTLKSATYDGILPLTRNMFFICYDAIYDKSFHNIPVCPAYKR